MKKGVTHCDTIGDIFKNPILLKFIADWYKIENDWKKLKIRKKAQEKRSFTPEFYEFIREIFEDRTDMERFLEYVREIILTSEKTSKKLFGRIWDGEGRKYSNQDIIKALLSFDEINDQLSNVEWLTIDWIFSTKIMEILRASYTEPSHREDDEEGIYDNTMLYEALEKTLDLLPSNHPDRYKAEKELDSL